MDEKRDGGPGVTKPRRRFRVKSKLPPPAKQVGRVETVYVPPRGSVALGMLYTDRKPK